MSYHVAELTGRAGGHGFGAVLSQLKAGVPVFFVISGFVLYLPIARAIRAGSALPAVAPYARRRAARILPAYWIALSIWLVILVVATGAGPTGAWVGDFGLVQIYSLRTYSGGLGPAWSLCVELTFYLALPLLGRGLSMLAGRVPASPARAQLAAIGALALASLGVRAAVSGSLFGAVPIAHAVLATALPATLDWFAAGMAAAVIVCEVAGAGDRFHRLRTPWVSSACFATGLALIGVAIPLQGGDHYVALDSLAAHLLLTVGGGLLVLAVTLPAAGPTTRLAATLGGPVMVWLGTISYGIFLFNLPALVIIRHFAFGLPVSAYLSSVLSPAGTVTMWVVVLGASIGLGAASWYLVERPAQAWAAGRDRRAPAPTTAQPATANSIAR